jgi:lysophospholipase L1-like esterase
VEYNIANIDESIIRFFGRTFYDSVKNAVYFNWTCSGFEFKFTGTKVEAELLTSKEHAEDVSSQGWVAVFVDDSEEPIKRFALNRVKDWYTLFETEVSDSYKIKVVKITEVQFGNTGLTNLRFHGQFDSLPQNTKVRKIEFIGDSITCGYGNEEKIPEESFKTCKENGWEAFAAKTARKLQAEYNCISWSGIGIYSSYTDSDNRNDSILMPMLYNYTDRPYEKRAGKSSYMEWNFKTFVSDLIVINLGTNDASYVRYDEDRKKKFRSLYMDFLKQLREKNGDHPKILCTLGSMDLYLFEEILTAVEEYKQQTGDKRIDTMAFELQLEEDGIGGSWHPSIHTHEKMSIKLCNKVSEYMEWQ